MNRDDDLTSWRAELVFAMHEFGDPGPVIAYAPSEAEFQVKFDGGYGGSEGHPVLAWTADRVYFPVVYDGAESMGSAPRNPQATGQPHVGGE